MEGHVVYLIEWSAPGKRAVVADRRAQEYEQLEDGLLVKVDNRGCVDGLPGEEGHEVEGGPLGVLGVCSLVESLEVATDLIVFPRYRVHGLPIAPRTVDKNDKDQETE